MKKKMMFNWVLSGIVASLFVGYNALGQVQTTDNFEESFEGFSVGDFIVQESGFWEGDPEAGVIVSTNYVANYVGGAFPLNYDHDLLNNALWFENTLTNAVPAGQSSQTNWVDMVLNPTFNDEEEAPALPPEGSIAGVYFTSNGTLVVSHTPDNSVTPITWVEIPDVQINEQDWIRLTIAANLQDGGTPFTGGNTRFYQIYINGEVVSNEVAFQSTDRESGGNGTWFGAAAGAGKTTLSGTVFQGTGYVDDVVVRNQSVLAQVAITDIDWPTLEDDGPFPYGSITIGDLVLNDDGEARDEEEDPIAGVFSIDADPSVIPTVGTNVYSLRFQPDDLAAFSPAVGGSVEVVVTALPLTITASNIVKEAGEEYVFVGNEFFTDPAVLVGDDEVTSVTLTSDGADEEAAPGTYDIVITDVDGVGLENYDMTWVNGTMTVEGDPEDGPSQAWLDAFGWTVADLDEDRGGGMTRREAWLASVNPQDTTELFEIHSVWQADGTNYIQWVSTYVDDTLPPFAIWARTNLMDEAYEVRGTHPRTAGDPISEAVTNVWYEAAPAYPVFYRIAGTNVVESVE